MRELQKNWIRTIPNRVLLSDARGYRRGVNYTGGNKARMEVEREIKRRKETGQMRKNVGSTKRRTSSPFAMPNIFRGGRQPSW